MATRAYITKDSTKEEIYQAYIDMQKKLKATVFHKKEIQNKNNGQIQWKQDCL